jgi:hypothetical protein
MKEPQIKQKDYFGVGITFFILSIVFYSQSNAALGSAFLPMGMVFLILTFQDKKKGK